MTPAKRSTSSTGSEGSRGKNGAKWSQMWGWGLQIGALEGPTGCWRGQNGTLRSLNGTQICSLGAQRGPQENQTKPESPQVCPQAPEDKFWLDLGDPKGSQNGAKSVTKIDLKSAPLPERFWTSIWCILGVSKWSILSRASGTNNKTKTKWTCAQTLQKPIKNTCFSFWRDALGGQKRTEKGEKQCLKIQAQIETPNGSQTVSFWHP